MSVTESYPQPSSSQLESDARRASSDQSTDAGKIAIGVIIGRTAEFFDFFVYGIASVVVFPRLLFPMLPPATATLYSFAIFALAFIARPIGSVVFMWIDRHHGRGLKLTVAMFLLGLSTVTIAFIPGYNDIGFAAAYFLASLRFVQGLALGGAWDGLASLLALNAPENRRGWYTMVPQLGAPIGFMLACLLFAFLIWTLSTADFVTWGWRYPFFVAFSVNVVALFARLRLVVTQEFGSLLEQHELEAARVKQTLRVNGRTVLLGAFVPLASYALFHLVTIFPLSWVQLYTTHSISRFLMVQCLGGLIGAATIMLSGLLADWMGRRLLLALGAVAIGAGSFITPFFYASGYINEDIIVLAGFAVLGFSFGQCSGALAANFRRTYRYTGAALTSDLAWLIGAGFAPLVALALVESFGLIAVGAYLLSGAVCTLIALFFNTQLERMRE